MIVPANVPIARRHAAVVAAALQLLGQRNGGLSREYQEIVRDLKALAELGLSVPSSANGTEELSDSGPAHILSNVSRLGVAEAADRLGLGERDVRARWVRGSIEAELVGGRWLIHPDEVERLLAAS